MRKALFGVVLVAASFAGGAVVNGPGLRWARAMVMNRLGLETPGDSHTPSDGSIPPLAVEPAEVAPEGNLDKDKPAQALSLPEPTVGEPKPDPEAKADTTPAAREPGSVSLPPTDVALSPTSNAPQPGANDWTEVRRGLREAGVSRYAMEGEPGGRVRFECVIPVAGRRAVSQHFEAEGDDEIGAARAVLKRIALWRAAEAEGHAP